MFIVVVATILLLCFFLTIRDRILYPRITSHSFKKTLKIISHHIAMNAWEEAENALALLFEQGKSSKEALLFRLQICRGTKRYEEGLACALSAMRQYPEELLFRLEEAKILIEMGRPGDALAAFRVCAPILRSESDFYDCALAHFLVGRIEICWELLEERLSSQNEKLLALAGDCQYELKQYSLAVTLYQKAIALGCVSQIVMNRLGHAYRKLGNLLQAEKIFRHILEKDEADVNATLGIGACLQERGYHLKALLFYQSLKSWEKKDPQILLQAGLCALITKRFHYSTYYFSEVIRLQGFSADLLFYLAFSLEGEQKWQEAEQTYLKLVKEFPSDSRGHRALAWLFGVGFSKTLSADQGLGFAYFALNTQPDAISWEIVSACEARRGNFQRAHQIQEYLLSQEEDLSIRSRRQNAMRTLRKHLPLDEQQVLRSQVA